MGLRIGGPDAGAMAAGPGLGTGADERRAWSRSVEYAPSRPANVPYSAARVDGELVDTDGGRYYSLLCSDGLLSLSTTTQAIFAEVDCGENWPPDRSTSRFLGLPEDIQVVPGDQDQRIIVISAAGAEAIRVPAGRIWHAPVAPGGVAR